MEDPPLLEEQYAPDTYKVLVTCIFLNKTEAVRARPHLEAFLEEYPSLDALQDADPEAIRTEYFADLGLFRRAYWLVEMASQLLSQPPRPNKLKIRSYKGAGYASEVAHLAGVGDYASDAWRLFCKKPFYASYGITIEDEWKTLDPQDKDLKRYVERKRREERTARQVDDITTWMAKVRLSKPPRSRPATSTLLVSGDSALRIPRRIINLAVTNSATSSGRLRESEARRAVATAS